MRANRVAGRGAVLAVLALACVLLGSAPVHAALSSPISLSFRQTPIDQVFEMLSREGHVNVLLGKGVSGTVSVNLYKVGLKEAIRSIAEAAGYVAEDRGDNTWMILSRSEAGKDSVHGNTEVRAFKVQYTDTKTVADMLKQQLSRYGKITTIPRRHMIVVQDLPGFLDRIGKVLAEVDTPPRQILIEARILEITLNSSSSYGIDWNAPLKLSKNGTLNVGTTGLAPTGISGLFFNVFTPSLEAKLNALRAAGRVRTLSTPRLLVMENQQAQVVIGDRIGYVVTTTINQVTTQSVQFIESGVILKVKASVDRAGRILLAIHPEVSTGTVNAGVPSLTTTEVTTEMLANSGQEIFIGGLIRNKSSQNKSGVPLLGDIPVIGKLFSSHDDSTQNTETVVLITPYIVNMKKQAMTRRSAEDVARAERALQVKPRRLLGSPPPPRAPSAAPAASPPAVATSRLDH